MSTTMQETCASVQSVTDVLTRLGDALSSGDLDACWRRSRSSPISHEALQQATATADDRAALLPHLTAARLALLRASLLGNSLRTIQARVRLRTRASRRDTTAPAAPANGSRRRALRARG